MMSTLDEQVKKMTDARLKELRRFFIRRDTDKPVTSNRGSRFSPKKLRRRRLEGGMLEAIEREIARRREGE